MTLHDAMPIIARSPRRVLRPAQGPCAQAPAGGAVRHAAAAARARSRRPAPSDLRTLFDGGRRRPARDRLRRRRASDGGGGAKSGDRLHRHRAVRQRHGEGARRHRRRAASPTSGCTTATRPTCWPGCRRRASRASICSIPTHGRSGAIGNGGSCRTDSIAADRARSCGPAANSGSRRDWPDYAAWTLRLWRASPDFEWTAERADDWRLPWPGFTSTRYEAKAKREGRVPCYLIFRRR